MTNKIKRTTDNQWLLSFEDNTWVEDLDDASGFTREETDNLSIALLDRLQPHEVEVYYNVYNAVDRITNGILKPI